MDRERYDKSVTLLGSMAATARRLGADRPDCWRQSDQWPALVWGLSKRYRGTDGSRRSDDASQGQEAEEIVAGFDTADLREAKALLEDLA